MATLRPYKQLPLLLLVSTFPRRPRALATLSGVNSPGTPSFCRPLPRHPAPYPPPRPGSAHSRPRAPRRARRSARSPPEAPGTPGSRSPRPPLSCPRSLPVPAAPGRWRLRVGPGWERARAPCAWGFLSSLLGSRFCALSHPPHPERRLGARPQVRLSDATCRSGPGCTDPRRPAVGRVSR
ncbi:atherin-like [Zalophus californianus]|uniref:Atherin-like n=1 Tax=Zalophus californianus TaxID=9704 RepID=A0A6J2FLN4_ZALCA|nr:atherin-like [Zalophus californianus]